MRKNWLSVPWTHGFRAQPVVPDAAFQGAAEPYPGHWRRFPEPWPALTSERRAALDAALADLPELWRRVVTADDVDLTLDQERAILARARAAVRDGLDRTWADGPG